MKKILATILALTMIVGMSIPAFAALQQPGAISITANYTKPDDEVDDEVIVYDVNVAYDNTVFTYTANGDTLVWDPAKLDYKTEVPGVGGSWDKSSATITVTNRSNAVVNIAASADNGFNVTATATCATAVGATEQSLPKATLTVTPPETPSFTTNTTVTVTVQLS